MSNRDIQVLLKISSEMDYLCTITVDMTFEGFDSNELLKRAVAMTLINIGELIRLLSEDIRRQYPAIPFKEMTATRNVAAHGYQTLRMDDIWETVKNDIPQVHSLIKEIILQ